ncbi:MAG TPA: carboxypeptidase-like regulatory domain-containing protein [Candidatus Baltobacteraceae bacterium]|nr:carboxypeptidase-like regulatory domain-containing protein [Candidatus Baltobacteraceae bacterium]
MKRFVPVLFASSAFVLAACGGGGGGINPPAGGGGSTPTPSPTPTLAPSTTSASGVVVNDANGAPLPGVKVALMPWGPCGATPSPATAITPQNDGCPTPLPSPQVTTDPGGNFTLNGVANGHYLLVIGNDVTFTPPPGYAPPTCTNNCPTPSPAPFTVQAVVHDNVTLTGGNQTLKAPTLPAVATITPQPWETNGDYRLATLDASTEMPCAIAWQYERAQHGLAYTSVDEWLTENTRAVNQATITNGGGSYTVLSIYGTNNSGGTDCATNLIDPGMFAVNPYAVDPRTLWFGGEYVPYNPNVASSARGIAEFPIDPRSNTDPNQPTWP